MRIRSTSALVLFLLASLAAATAPVADSHAPEETAPRLLDLGSQRHSISTSAPEAQRYFDQGLILTFGFNHEAAVRSFEHAAKLDPDCAMCGDEGWLYRVDQDGYSCVWPCPCGDERSRMLSWNSTRS